MSLKEFFIDEKIIFPFHHFGLFHFLLIFTLLIICIFLSIKALKINKLKETHKQKILKTLAIIFLLNMLILYISSFYYHNFNYQTMLPLHLCYLSNYYYIFTVLLNQKKLYTYIYYLAFLGPIPAIIFFDVPSIFESFNFYLYLISHHLLVIAGLICFYMYPQKIKLNQIIKLYLSLNVINIFIMIFNFYFHTNYFFSNSIPLFIIKALPFLKFFPTPYILQTLIIFLIIILTIFWHIIYRKLNKNN